MPEIIDTRTYPRYSVTRSDLRHTQFQLGESHATFPAGRRTVRHPGIDGRGLQEAGGRPGSGTATTSGCAAATTAAAAQAGAITTAATRAADRRSDLREEDGGRTERGAGSG